MLRNQHFGLVLDVYVSYLLALLLKDLTSGNFRFIFLALIILSHSRVNHETLFGLKCFLSDLLSWALVSWGIVLVKHSSPKVKTFKVPVHIKISLY